MMETHPFVTVIMPIRNEAAYIARSLGAVLAQDYPADRMEILVVDGMSEDGTRETVAGLQIRNSQSEIRILDNPARIVPTALNIGLRHARGEVIVRVDGHCEIAPDYARRCVDLLRETGADNVGGMWITIGETFVARAIALAQSSPFGVGGVAYRVRRSTPGYVDTVPFGAFRREVFGRIGGFDEALVRHQDYEFNCRLRAAGGKVYYSPTIRARYHSRSTFRRLAIQYFQYGFWKAYVTWRKPRALTWRHLAPISLVLVLALGVPATFCLPVLLPFYGALWGVYALTCLGASLLACARGGWHYLPLLPLAFATIHLCWGAGFWWGILSHLRGLAGSVRRLLPQLRRGGSEDA